MFSEKSGGGKRRRPRNHRLRARRYIIAKHIHSFKKQDGPGFLPVSFAVSERNRRTQQPRAYGSDINSLSFPLLFELFLSTFSISLFHTHSFVFKLTIRETIRNKTGEKQKQSFKQRTHLFFNSTLSLFLSLALALLLSSANASIISFKHSMLKPGWYPPTLSVLFGAFTAFIYPFFRLVISLRN